MYLDMTVEKISKYSRNFSVDDGNLTVWAPCNVFWNIYVNN